MRVRACTHAHPQPHTHIHTHTHTHTHSLSLSLSLSRTHQTATYGMCKYISIENSRRAYKTHVHLENKIEARSLAHHAVSHLHAQDHTRTPFLLYFVTKIAARLPTRAISRAWIHVQTQARKRTAS